MNRLSFIKSLGIVAVAPYVIGELNYVDVNLLHKVAFPIYINHLGRNGLAIDIGACNDLNIKPEQVQNIFEQNGREYWYSNGRKYKLKNPPKPC